MGTFPLPISEAVDHGKILKLSLQAQGKECCDLLVMSVKDRQRGSVEHFPQPGKPDRHIQGSGGCVVLRKG